MDRNTIAAPGVLRAGTALAEPCIERPTTALETIRNRICNLNERASNHECRLEDLRDRVLAPEPRSEGGENNKTDPCGLIDQIMAEIEHLVETLDHTTSLIVRLEDL